MQPSPGRTVYFWPHERCDEPMVCVITRVAFNHDLAAKIKADKSDIYSQYEGYQQTQDERCYDVWLIPIYDPGVRGALAYGNGIIDRPPFGRHEPKHKHWTWPPRV